MIWRHRQSRFSPTTFPNRIQVHHLLHTQPPLHSQTWKRPSLPPKSYKIHLFIDFHFLVRRHFNSTLQQKIGAITNLQDKNDLQYSHSKWKYISSVHSKWKYISSVVFPPGLKLDCLTCKIGVGQYVVGLIYLPNRH